MKLALLTHYRHHVRQPGYLWPYSSSKICFCVTSVPNLKEHSDVTPQCLSDNSDSTCILIKSLKMRGNNGVEEK